MSTVTHSSLSPFDVNHNTPVLVCKAKVKGPTSVRKVQYWSTDRVCCWLKKKCTNSYCIYGKLFRDHEITGQVLINLTDYKLMLMGIESSEHREEILIQTLKLKLQFDTYALLDLQKSGMPIDEEL